MLSLSSKNWKRFWEINFQLDLNSRKVTEQIIKEGLRPLSGDSSLFRPWQECPPGPGISGFLCVWMATWRLKKRSSLIGGALLGDSTEFAGSFHHKRGVLVADQALMKQVSSVQQGKGSCLNSSIESLVFPKAISRTWAISSIMFLLKFLIRGKEYIRHVSQQVANAALICQFRQWWSSKHLRVGPWWAHCIAENYLDKMWSSLFSALPTCVLCSNKWNPEGWGGRVKVAWRHEVKQVKVLPKGKLWVCFQPQRRWDQLRLACLLLPRPEKSLMPKYKMGDPWLGSTTWEKYRCILATKQNLAASSKS